jgi:ketosteroid isomerase-like protein
MSVELNKKIARALVEGLGADRNDALSGLLHDEAQWSVMANPASFPVTGVMSKTQFLEHMQRFRQAVPNGLEIAVTGVTAEGDRVAIEAESSATLMNGNVMSQVYHFLFEIRSEKVYRVREYIDTAHGVAVLEY